jgi:alkylation response protein AidB-like acyl-CoA dehydrogenase
VDFSLSAEQAVLKNTLEGFLARRYDQDIRRTAVNAGIGWRPDIWTAFGEDLALFGLLVPERFGGAGNGPIEAMILMEAMGRHLVLEPVLETVVMGSAVLAHLSEPLASTFASRLMAGAVRLAFAQAEPRSRYSLENVATTAWVCGDGFEVSGHKAVVIGAPIATDFLVTVRTSGERIDREGLSILLIDAQTPGITRRDYRTVDGRLAADLYFERVKVAGSSLIGPSGDALPIVESLVDHAVAGVCAEACGVMRALLDATIAYTKERKQFGRPLASFQVLQHRMVDMFLQLEGAISMSLMASVSLAARSPEARRDVAAAKVAIGQACNAVAKSAVQLHGAVGITDELALSHYFKRAITIESQFGSVDHFLSVFQTLKQSGDRPQAL